MSRNVTVAATQMACSWDLEGNIEVAERLVREAAAKGAQIILMPGKRTAKGISRDTANGAASITLDDSGKAEFELEVTW